MCERVHFEFVEGVLFWWLAVHDKGNCSSRVVNEQEWWQWWRQYCSLECGGCAEDHVYGSDRHLNERRTA